MLKAARALAARIPGLVTGAFRLDKELPVAAGLGGGSADAAAALRLLARANDLPADDPRLYEAARATGADVPVCLDPRPRLMRGIGEKLSAPLNLPPLPAVLVNPGVALATKDVFAGWTRAVDSLPPFDLAALEKTQDRRNFCRSLAQQANDLEAAAVKLAPVVGDVLAALRALAGCRLARMSGSGATCFGFFDGAAEARRAADAMSNKYPRWWVRACVLASASELSGFAANLEAKPEQPEWRTKARTITAVRHCDSLAAIVLKLMVGIAVTVANAELQRACRQKRAGWKRRCALPALRSAQRPGAS